MSNLSVPELPQPDSKDKVYKFVSAALSIVTLDAAGLFAMIMKDPSEKRLNEFVKSLAENFEKLQQQMPELTVEKLQENDALVSTIAQLTYSAIATHEKERLDAMRNAVLNTAIERNPDDITQKLFNQWLQELTPWHWKILPLFDHPSIANIFLELGDKDWKMMIQLDEVASLIEHTYPEMKGHHNLYIHIISDLYSRGLIANLFPEKEMSTQIEHSPKLTKLARGFLMYIKSPLNE